MSHNPPPLNRGMNLRQLIEGQKEQIISLSPSSPITLYHPTDINGAANILMGQNKLDYYPVLPSLKHAVKHGDVIMQFYGLGRHLQTPRDNQESAKQQYPDSFNPSVSFILMSLNPMVYYTGLISPANIDKLYVMNNGTPEAMIPSDFMKYAIKDRADRRRQQG